MKLRAKLRLALVPLVATTAFTGIFSFATVSSLATRAEAILKDNQRSILAVQKMQDAVARVDGAMMDALLGRAAVGVPAARDHLERLERELRIQEGNITEPGEDLVTRELRAAATLYAASTQRLLLMTPGPEWNQTYLGEARPALQRVTTALQRILVINQDAVVRKSMDAQRAAAAVRTALLWVLALAMVLGLYITERWTGRLLRPLQDVTQAARSLGNQDFNARAPVLGNDEIAELTREFNAMAQRLAVYQSSTLGELLAAQRSAQAAIDSLPDPVLTFDAQGRLVNLNLPAEEVLRVRMAGDQPLAGLPPVLRETVERTRDHVRAGKGAWVPRGLEDAVRVTTLDQERHLLPRAAPVHDENGHVVGVTLVLQDVTRLRRFDELKNNLVATVAHEFRTPLTSLRMAIHLCLDGVVGELTDKQRDLLEAARHDCGRLQSMVDDLLDLSRIEGGALAVSTRPVEVSQLLAAALTAHEGEATSRNVRLTVDEPVGLPAVNVDQDRIALVFDNLVGNALRYTPPEGSITLRAHHQDGQVRFEVQDTGPGVEPQYRTRVFEKFFRVPGQARQGAGFGLFIAREVVQAHGGKMAVEGAPGGGALFWFTLPVATVAQP
ncbi:MAG: HAMP domain-containing protein [Deltaproteobacteria bacterium]|nr:HAMP domain-containing protein [Deltaproteobacteria bacterium]